MNQPSREQIEARITALLLGELPADEAELLRFTISQDAALKQLHDELASTIVLVREAAKTPADAPAEKAEALKLSQERREKLLAHFQTPPPPDPLFWLKRIEVPSLVPVLACVALVALVAAMLLPALSGAKSKSARLTLVNGRRVAEMEARYAEKQPASPADEPMPLTATVAPMPAAPPVAIVLPPTEAPAQVDPATGLPAEGRNAGVISQNVVGYANPQPVDIQPSLLKAENNLGLPAQNVAANSSVDNLSTTFARRAAPSGGSQFGSGGGGAGGAAGGIMPGDIGGARNLGEEYRHAVPAQTDRAALVNDFSTAAQAAPAEKLPEIARNRVADENSVERKLAGNNSDQLLTSGLRDEDRFAADNKFYRQPVSESKTASVKVRRIEVSPDSVLKKTPQFAESETGVPIVTAAPASVAPTDFFAAGELAKRTDVSKFADKSGSGTFAFGGDESSAAGTLTVSGSSRVLSAGKGGFYSGLTKDDLAGLRYLTTTNAVVLNGNFSKILGPLPTAGTAVAEIDRPLPKPAPTSLIPQPEVLCRENNFSTFSLNVSDVSFKLAAAILERGQMPDAASIRSEEFINAFDYRDPEAAAGQPLAFASERARYPFAQNRELLRFSVKTAAAGRPAGRALNLVLLLDNSGSMERADRVAIIREALRVLATQLQPQDTVSVVTFARTARLWADGVSGDTAGAIFNRVGGITPEGGTNLEEAMRLAYETARRHYLANGLNRVVLLTDGAANLGNVSATALKEKVEAQRKQGIALDCFGIGQQDYNDELLEQLSSNGDGRYAFLNSPEDASKEFAAKLAGALQIAASDVKVQVEFNPQRVISYRQIGYAKHQLTKEQFRDNTVDAAEIAAQEAGNALYTVETKADGIGPIATVRVRYKVPGTTDYRERSWDVAYTGNAVALEQSSAAMRLAATASAFSEWLASSPFAQEATPDELLKTLSGVPQIYGADQRPKKLEWMIRQAKSLSGK
jgi:Mg-chelatase subunit ChlD/anti-sigma factor RsiW